MSINNNKLQLVTKVDYKKHYYLLVEKARSRETNTGYFERHHILPRCMGGNDSSENLVKLTPEEHYIAHQLLVKMYPGHYGLLYAAVAMCRDRPNNKLYGWVRRRLAKMQSYRMLNGGSPTRGRRWIANENEILLVDKTVADAIIQEGTHIAGKVAKRAACGHLVRIRCKSCENKRKHAQDKKKQAAKDMAHCLFEEFKNSECKSLCEFARFKNTSQPRLTQLWKKYVVEYSEKRAQGKRFKG